MNVDRLTFTVPGEPVPCERARVVRNQRTGKIHGMTPARTRAYEERVSWSARAALAAHRDWRPEPGWSYTLVATIYRARDAGDWDNFGKAIADGCNGIVWCDDRRILDGRIVLCIDRKSPRAEVTITRVACAVKPARKRMCKREQNGLSGHPVATKRLSFPRLVHA